VLALSACSGGSEVGNNQAFVDPATPAGVVCSGHCQDTPTFLTVADIKKIIAQAVAEAAARNAKATIAVTDRVGNVLAVYRMGDPATRVTTIATALNADGSPVVFTGLEGISLPTPALPLNIDQLAAIAKAITGAYLSSEGNAFSSRTANTIVQENFYPGIENNSSGPLFGVQFSSLRCSDTIMRPPGDASVVSPGIHSSPLGLSADPGGFPLYKNGTVVGGVGILADGIYGIDKDIFDTDKDLDEIVALAATFGFGPSASIEANRSAVINAMPLRYRDATPSDLVSNPATAIAFDSIPSSVGALIAVAGYTTATIKQGTAFGHPESGVRPDTGTYPADRDAFVLVDAQNMNRFVPRAGLDAAVLGGVMPLQAAEVTEIISQALNVANTARAGIRSIADGNQKVAVTVSITDSLGNVVGVAKTRDAPVFGTEVSLQKGRSSALLSSPTAAAYLKSLPVARYLTTLPGLIPPPPRGFDLSRTVNLGDYVDAYRSFVNNPNALMGETAFSDRAIGNLARPFFPDGINRTTVFGPFSKKFGDWSVFSSGLQLDLSINGILQHVVFAAGGPVPDASGGCVGTQLAPDLSSAGQTQPGVVRAGNGLQIFAGGFPIYRDGPNGEDILVGSIGISGDGIDQDDMVGFLGLDRASKILAATTNTPPRHALPRNRADALVPAGSDLQKSPVRYVQCPQAPFLNSDVQRVCEGK